MKSHIIREYQKITKKTKHWGKRKKEIGVLICIIILLGFCMFLTFNMSANRCECLYNIINSILNEKMKLKWDYEAEILALTFVIYVIVIFKCLYLRRITTIREINCEDEYKANRDSIIIEFKKVLAEKYNIKTQEQFIELRLVFHKTIEYERNREKFYKTIVITLFSGLLASIVVKFWDSFGVLISLFIATLLCVGALMLFEWWGFINDFFSKRYRYEQVEELLDEVILSEKPSRIKRNLDNNFCISKMSK